MGAGIRRPDQNRILVLGEVSRAAIHHPCQDPIGARWKYLNYTPVLIVLPVGSEDFDGKRVTLHRRVLVVGHLSDPGVDDVDASVAV